MVTVVQKMDYTRVSTMAQLSSWSENSSRTRD